MYIALKWLIGMALTMWIILCTMEIYQSKMFEIKVKGFKFKDISAPLYKNKSIEQQNVCNSKKIHNLKAYNGYSSIFRYSMFLAGACILLIYNKKNIILTYVKTRLRGTNFVHWKNILTQIRTGTYLAIAILLKYIQIIGKTAKTSYNFFYTDFIHKPYDYKKSNLVLLEKLKEMGQERKNLSQLLLAAIQENKNIRTRYQLESMAKNRLARYIEDTQKQIKENRTRYVNFQQLYLITHQENTFLKSRLKKITKEKEEAVRNLIKLVNQVCHSRNNDLKAYCSRFIVRTTNNLFNFDVHSEIQQFLRKFYQSVPHEEISISHKITECSNPSFEINEIFENEENLTDLVKEAPKLRGLPGECVWTVKDKHGIIEKLYEYETEFDNGDTIRKIRQYSVYHDKDCLLEFSNSATAPRNSNLDISDLQTSFLDTEKTITSQKFLTGSPAFQNFLENNKNIVLHQPPSSICPFLKC